MSRFLAWITSILLLFLVLEGITRLVSAPKHTQPDAVLGWTYRPDFHVKRTTDGQPWDFRTNARGLRAPAGLAEGPKVPGEQRILLLGDSFTLGWGLELDETFAAKLESELAAQKRPATIVPAGTEGYALDQECIWLEERGAAYAPDLVVVLPYANDVLLCAQPKYLAYDKPMFTVGSDGVASRPKEPVRQSLPLLVRWSRLASQVHGMALGFSSVLSVPEGAGGGRLQLDDWSFLKTEPAEAKAGWAATEAIARRLVGKATAMGARVAVCPIPNRFEIQPSEGDAFAQRAQVATGALDFSKPTRRFGEIFAAAGATVIDVKPALATRASVDRLYFPRDWHFNATGAEAFGRELARGLDQSGLLAPAGSTVAPAITLASVHVAHGGGVPTWLLVVAGLWVVLSLGFKLSYPDENPLAAFAKVGLLLTSVVGVFAGIAWLLGVIPPLAKTAFLLMLVVSLGTYAIYKTRHRFGAIRELFGALVDRGHWYLVPMLVVMLTISILLVVAQNPIVAPFIYTLF